MNEPNKKIQLLGSVPIPKALIALGLPTMTGMLINALYNLADTYFVGGLGTDQMGAVTLAFPLGQIIVGLGLLFGNGAAAYLSRLLGKGDKETGNRVASTALYSSVSIGALAIIISLFFLKPILKQLGAIESVMPYALTYTTIYIAFSIFTVFNVTMNNIVSSEGAARTAMYALLCGAVLNVILDPILIYVCDLGVAGAAEIELAPILGIEVEHQTTLQNARGQATRPTHAGLLIHSQQGFDRAVDHVVAFQNCQDQGHANAVIRTQRRFLGDQPAFAIVRRNGITGKIMGAIGILLAHHVHVGL